METPSHKIAYPSSHRDPAPLHRALHHNQPARQHPHVITTYLPERNTFVHEFAIFDCHIYFIIISGSFVDSFFALSRPSTFSALIRCSFCTLLCRAFTFVRQTIESQSSLSLCNCPHLIEYDTFGRTLTDTKSNCAEHRSYRKQ